MSAFAGGDPWHLNDELQAGDAAAINELADAFHQSGVRIKDADDEFATARQAFLGAYNRDGVRHPINDSAEVQRVSAALAGHPEELTRIAADLEQTAAALAAAQRDGAAEIEGLDAKLHNIDEQISTEVRTPIAIVLMQLFRDAADATRAALTHIEEIRGAYVEQLRVAETAMMASGYVPDALDGVDGIPGDSPRDAATRYDQSGQRARDQAMVDQARAAKGDGILGWSYEEQDAGQRLEDYISITDPAHGVAHRGSGHDQDQAARLAGERLDDFNVAHSTGLVARDPVLGGDARDRANTRLTLQHDLVTGQLPSSRQPMLPDDATALMDRMEVTERANALTRLQEQLQQAGMTPQGAAAVADGLANGVIPQQYVDAASGFSQTLAGGKEAFIHLGDSLPTGRHWGPGVAFSAEDVEALGKIGGHIGVVGNVMELGVGLYEWQHGVPAGEVVAGTAGSLAGAWALGGAGAELGASAGPPGVFVGALVGGTVGAFGGKEIAMQAFKWLTE